MPAKTQKQAKFMRAVYHGFSCFPSMYLTKLVRSITTCEIKGSRFFAARKGGNLVPSISSLEFMPLRDLPNAVKIDRLRGKPRRSGRGQERGRRSRPYCCLLL